MMVVGLGSFLFGGATACNISFYLSPAGDLFTEAAEAAMAAMKGRLANQYYMKAEEAWAQMEE